MMQLDIDWGKIGFAIMYIGMAFMVGCIIFFGIKHLLEAVNEVKRKHKKNEK